LSPTGEPQPNLEQQTKKKIQTMFPRWKHPPEYRCMLQEGSWRRGDVRYENQYSDNISLTALSVSEIKVKVKVKFTL
jgi:hypothetical protein